MSLLSDLLSSLKEDRPVEEAWACVFWTAVVAGRCGLASTTPPSSPHGGAPIRDVGHLARRSARTLAEWLTSSNTLEASIGLAALNALVSPPQEHLSEGDIVEILLREARGKRLAVVGHFPFLGKLSQEAKELQVLELAPAPGELPAEEAAKVLPQAEVVAITGSALINHTLEGLLKLCPQASFRAVVGPSTPLSPVLFDYGVDVLAGVEVVDIPEVLRYIREGANFRQVKGVRKVTLERKRLG